MPSTKEKFSRQPMKPSPQTDLLHKVSFGAIGRKKEDTKTSYPVLPDPNGQLAVIATHILERTEQVEALSGALEIDKAELKTLATPFYFTQASGKLEVASSVSVVSAAGEVLITFPNRYGKLESEAALVPIVGERTASFFRQAFTLEIDGDKLPAEKAQELLDQLQQLFSRYHAAEALKVKEGIKPVPDFHTVRHTALSPEQNLALNQVCPIIAMIKTKGRRSGPKEGA
jgi:Xaa-Pro aminopeptidase